MWALGRGPQPRSATIVLVNIFFKLDESDSKSIGS